MKKITLSLLISLLLMACQDSNLTQDSTTETNINGYIQKGPFITGTTIQVNELNNEMNPTGKSFSTQITSDFGDFAVNVKSSEKYAEFIADGYYFNEVSGQLSDSRLALRAIARINEKVNVNPLTTLQAPRVKELIQQGVEYEKALEQSKAEVLSLFSITQNSVEDFHTMNIAQQGESNSILLAVSSVLQTGNSVAEMSELISKLALDIADNGVVDSEALVQKVNETAWLVDCETVARNLENRYHSLGLDVNISSFHNYIKAPYVWMDCENITIPGLAKEVTLEFTANFTPSISIEASIGEITKVTNSSATISLKENTSKEIRSIDLEFSNSDDTFNKVFSITQFSQYTKVGVNLHSDDSMILDNITVIGFDDKGELVFVHADKKIKPINSVYWFYTQLTNTFYQNCRFYIITYSNNDYSGFNGNESSFKELITSNSDQLVFEIDEISLNKESIEDQKFQLDANNMYIKTSFTMNSEEMQLSTAPSQIKIKGSLYVDNSEHSVESHILNLEYPTLNLGSKTIVKEIEIRFGEGFTARIFSINLSRAEHMYLWQYAGKHVDYKFMVSGAIMSYSFSNL